jgi:hypothetical protein
MKTAILLVLAGLSIAQAAEPTGTLTLACEGTTTNMNIKTGFIDKPEPVSMGIIVDFAALKVEFSDAHFPIPIEDITETTVAFYGNNLPDPLGPSLFIIDGTIDRVTGGVEAKLVQHGDRHDRSGNGLHLLTTYSLKCQPTQRML